ncbi:type VI secretion system Vgr family protein [Spirosoma agri]|uniref:Type VI secretion system tip protein VgrG n=1 Tax=Spirosoma agri TaxID=1987381 RepID=A0A6M0IRS5_9BACT|nr:type VI secretion system tip protein VgrG [Spirosoma agri]NEU69663.1 type VI secretion system tip protein VgrG [Spirosoma agri]
MPSTNQYIATAEVTINGTTLKRFNSVRICQRFDSHHEFTLTLSPDMLDSGSTVKLKDLGQNFVGEAVSIKFKQGEKGQTGAVSETQTLLFKGIVTGVQLLKSHLETNSITITGSSPTLLFSASRTTRSFDEMTPSAIIEKIASSLGLSVSVSATSNPKLPYITQYQEDDFTFAQRLARDYGQWFFYDGEKVYYGKRSSDTGVALIHGSNFFDMDYRLRVSPMKMTANYYDFSTGEFLSSAVTGNDVDGLQEFAKLVRDKSSALFKDDPVDISYQNHQKEDTLKNAAKLRLSEMSTKLAVLQGRTAEMQLKIGGLVKIKDAIYAVSDARQGAQLQETIDYGTFLVTQLNHYFDSRGVYQATFEAVPQDTEFPPVAYNVVTPNAECQPAIVKRVDDPDGLGRIQVQFAWQKDSNQTTPWVRVAQPMAYKDRGVYFIPEVNEIVFVDFEFGNPDLPFVRGTMFHGNNTPGPLFNQDNNIKGIITRGGNHILISDEAGKESIKIYNKDNKNEIVLSLDGETTINIKSEGKINIEAKDTITMKAKTIEMTADQEWKVKAGKTEISNDQGMKISANTKVELAGQAGVKVEGANIDIEAQAQASIKANAQLALESSGQASLKGAVVMIN